MVAITLEELTENLPLYLQRVKAGEHFVVLQAGESIAELSPIRNLSFGESIKQFRQKYNLEEAGLDPDEIFQGVRDCSPGREVNF